MTFVESCRHFIGLDSSPSRGTREAGEYFAGLCQMAGLSVEIDNESLNGVPQVTVIARPQKSSRNNEIMFQTHLDTIEPGPFPAWTKTQSNPFNASIHNEAIFGLGVADAKLDLLCKLEAFKDFVHSDFRKPPVLVATYGAQAGMVGAVKLMRRKRVRAGQALVGEPTDFKIGNSCNGLAIVEVSIPFSTEEIHYREEHDQLESGSTQSKIFMGKSAHSADPTLGENAIVKMLDYLVQLPSGIAIMDLDGGTDNNTIPSSAVLEIDAIGSLRDPIVTKLGKILVAFREMEVQLKKVGPPFATVNIGTIRTDDEHVRLTGSCRIPPNVRNEDYEGWIESIRRQCSEIGASFSVRDYKGAFFTNENSPLIRSIQSLLAKNGASADLEKVSTSTEANVFSRFGIECVVIGPGQGIGNSHGANEMIKLSDLSHASELYRQIIKELCL